MFNGHPANDFFHLFSRQFPTFQILFQQFVIMFGHLFPQVVAPLLGLGGQTFRNRLPGKLQQPVVVLPGQAFHGQEVNDAGKLRFPAHRQLHGDRAGLQFFPHLLQDGGKVAAQAVHFVDEGQAGNMVAVGLVPDGFRLRLNAADGAENGHHAVENPQAPLHFNGKVNVSRRINNGDRMLFPAAGGGGGGNGNAPLLLLLHPVHQRRAVMNLPDFMGQAGAVKDPLGDGGLAGVNMGGNADIS